MIVNILITVTMQSSLSLCIGYFLDIKNVRTGCEDAYLGEIVEYVCVHATNKQTLEIKTFATHVILFIVHNFESAMISISYLDELPL